MNRIEPIKDVLNLHTAAADLSELLALHSNYDIRYGIPDKHPLLAHDPDVIYTGLLAASANVSPGVCQYWIAFDDEKAVGLAALEILIDSPEYVPIEYPRFNIFVCDPHRNKGIGSLAIITCLKTAVLEFGGFAWTSVKHHDKRYQKLVLSAGFIPLKIIELETVYTYSWNGQNPGG